MKYLAWRDYLERRLHPFVPYYLISFLQQVCGSNIAGSFLWWLYDDMVMSSKSPAAQLAHFLSLEALDDRFWPISAIRISGKLAEADIDYQTRLAPP